MPAEPGALGRDRAAHAVVADAETTRLPFRRGALRGHLGRPRVLGRVGERLAGHEVGRGLEPVLEALLGRLDPGPQRRAGRQLAQRRASPSSRPAGPHPPRQLAQLLDRPRVSSSTVASSSRGLRARPRGAAPGRGAARGRSTRAAAGRRRGGRARAAAAPRSPAVTMRARDSSTSASRRRTSTRRRAISIARPAAPMTLSSRSGRSPSAASCTTVASCSAPRRTGVRARPGPRAAPRPRVPWRRRGSPPPGARRAAQPRDRRAPPPAPPPVASGAARPARSSARKRSTLRRPS